MTRTGAQSSNAKNRRSPDLSSIERLVVVAPSWVGDVVMATPVFRALRAGLPQAHITGVMRPGLDDVLRGLPWLDQLTICNMKGPLGVMRLAKAMRRTGATAAMLLPNSFRTAAAARLSGAAIRIGYIRDGRGWLLSHGLEAPQRTMPIPAVDYYARLACFALDVETIDTKLELATTPHEEQQAAAMLHDVDRPLVVLNPGATRVEKRWPADRFASVADILSASHQLAIAVSGSPKERDLLREIVQAAKTPIINLLERGVTLGSLKAVIRRARLMITNDTGPRHIAAAFGTPLVTLFGPTDHRWTTLHGVREHILLAEPFLPEELMADRYPKLCTIERISVGDVVAAAERQIAQSAHAHQC